MYASIRLRREERLIPAPATELEVKKWDYAIAVNLRGPFLVTQTEKIPRALTKN
jgi:NAD(P)-dependent dehydrogenase (short-subunit alcohol dehydrogenase family)